MSTTTVGDYMTPNPVTIASDLSLAGAVRRMHDHDIRHLPVLEQGQVVGVVSERDLALVMAIPGVHQERVRVTEAMTPHPYVVDPGTPLEEVIAVMHERKLGAAVIMEDGELRGIFSVVDALAALLDLLEAE